MKVKVTSRLTYPEASKLYEQHKPDFTFAKVVQSMAAKPETKVASTQYSVKYSEITESSKVIIARITKQNTQNSTSSKSSSEKTAQRQQNQAKHSKQTKQIVLSDGVKKGSEDPIKNQKMFGALADDGDMDTDESVVRSGARGSRPRSPVKAPK